MSEPLIGKYMVFGIAPDPELWGWAATFQGPQAREEAEKWLCRRKRHNLHKALYRTGDMFMCFLRKKSGKK